MFLLFVLFIIGVILIVKGGDAFVDSASNIAKISGVPQFIIGATIVSIATTLPEILVSTLAAFQGKTEIAIGNAIGSVTANTGLILAFSVICIPSVIKRSQYTLKIILLILTMIALTVLCLPGELQWTYSIILFIIFAVFMVDNVREGKRLSLETPPHMDADDISIKKTIIQFIFGTIGIVLGSQLLIDNGSEIALRLGIPENIIALTAISIGTSLPELVTAVSAIIKKQASLSLGNIIGANLIDTALILPLCAMINGRSIPISPQTIYLDLPVCLLVTVILFIPALIMGKFKRWQGFLGMAVYIGYVGYISFF